MQIVPCNSEFNIRYSTGELTSLSLDDITRIMGFSPNLSTDVETGWVAHVDQEFVVIWVKNEKKDRRKFHTFGDPLTLRKLFSAAFSHFEEGWR